MARSRSRKGPQGVVSDLISKSQSKWETTLTGRKVVMYAVEIDPDLAQRILDHCNLRNRRVRQNKVLQFSESVESQQWEHIAILIMTSSGELLDGQHRLLGVVESGEPAGFMVRMVQPSEAEKIVTVLDIGTPRNIADYLHFNGVADSSRVAPVLRYERNARVTGSPLQNTKGTKPEYLALYREIGEESLKSAFEIVPRGLHKRLEVNRAFLDWFSLHTIQVDHDGAQLFFGLLEDPSQLKKTDPPYILRDMLIDMARKNERISLVQQAHMTAKAWRYFAEGQPATPAKIKHRVNDDWPGVFGE